MDMLFRPGVTRVKTPVMGSTPDRQSSASADDSYETEEIIPMNNRARTTPRIPSYMSFRPGTPTIPAPECFPIMRNPETIYHKPSGDQLAEMLKVIMMNQSTMDPVPIEYNSTILHVLEAYHDLRTQLSGKEEAIEMLKQSHTRDIKEFEDLTFQWVEKENDYKLEVKRLEVLLSKTEGGMESVAVARSKSVIHGTAKASETINRDFDSADVGPAKKNFKLRHACQVRDDQDVIASASFTDRHQLRKRNRLDPHSAGEQSPTTSGIPQPYDSPAVKAVATLMQDGVNRRQYHTKAHLEALDGQQIQEFGAKLESSTSGGESSPMSYRSDIAVRKTSLLGLGIHEKPLPEIPLSKSERPKSNKLDKYLSSRQHNYSDPDAGTPLKPVGNNDLGFSFRPGDDDELLCRRSMDRDRARRKAVDEELDYRPFMPNLNTGFSTPVLNKKGTSGRPRRIREQDDIPAISPRPSQLPRIQDTDHVLGRMDSSSSSIITAIRDNSGRSSTNNSRAGRPKLKGNTASTSSGSSEAVTAATAAARAYTASTKGPSSEMGRKASASGERRKASKRYDGEDPQVSTVIRNTSTSSTGSSLNGSENGHGKSLMGEKKMAEES